jgi:hypothetical protein
VVAVVLVAMAGSQFAGATPGATGQIGPYVVPASQKQAAWFVDFANTSGCASDNNRTCSLATCGTSGDGPCTSFGSIVSRWGTTSPYLAQTTTITWLSSSPLTDFVAVTPVYAVANAKVLVFQGVPTVLGTVTLGTVTPKNRNTPQLLTAVMAGVAEGQFLVNPAPNGVSANASAAFVYTNVSGNTWNISQPLKRLPPGTSISGTTEVDTWTAGDVVTIETFPSVNIERVEPTFGLVQSNPQTWINNVNLPDTDSVTNWGGTQWGPLVMTESTNHNCVSFNGSIVNFRRNSLGEANVYSWEQCASTNPGNWYPPAGDAASLINFYGGVIKTAQALGMVDFDFDTILNQGTTYDWIWSQSAVGLLYLDTNAGLWLMPNSVLNVVSGAAMTPSNQAIIWGPGYIAPTGLSRINYANGAGNAAATFLNGGGIAFYGLVGVTRACLGGTLVAAGGAATCNISLTPANLDTNLGASFGCLGHPTGGPAVCNERTN